MTPAAVPGPRRAFVRLVLDVPAREAEDEWVLEEENMPESPTHRDTVDLLRLLLLAFVARTRRQALVAANLGCRWDPDHPNAGVDPDVALIEPAPPGVTKLRTLRTWEPGHVPPRFAIEVVSDSNPEKDYLAGPAKYARLGTRELVVFDPGRRGPEGFRDVLQVWRRNDGGGDGASPTMTRVYAGDGPAYSEELSAWLIATAEQQLRIADDPEGRALWLTEAEANDRRAEANAKEARAKDQIIEAKDQAIRAALCSAIEYLCEARGVPLDDARRAQLQTLDVAGLEALRARIERDRAWPA